MLDLSKHTEFLYLQLWTSHGQHIHLAALSHRLQHEEPRTVDHAFDREFASDVAVQSTSAQRWLSLLRSGDSMPLIRGLM